MDFPSLKEEMDIISRIDTIERRKCERLVTLDQVESYIESARQVFVSDAVKSYIVSLANHLRNWPDVKNAPSTRASIALRKGSRALAFLGGRDHVIPDDVKTLAPYVFMHRVFLKPEAIAEEVTSAKVVSEMLERVLVPKE